MGSHMSGNERRPSVAWSPSRPVIGLSDYRWRYPSMHSGARAFVMVGSTRIRVGRSGGRVDASWKVIWDPASA